VMIRRVGHSRFEHSRATAIPVGPRTEVVPVSSLAKIGRASRRKAEQVRLVGAQVFQAQLVG
jgi:hypothetical protein